ncbi:MAG: LamG domain-containing protein, partial [Candidatus Latescibacteria bacterium]|nr:LamG domain-containing protein [Candidatus Latescibacterota bacterium]
MSGLMAAMAFGASSVSAQSYVSQWSAEDNVWDSVGNNDNGFWTSDGRAGYVPVESYVPGKVGKAFNINWPTWIEVPQDEDLTMSGSMTTSLWFRTDRNKNGALLSINDSWQVFLLGEDNQCGFNNPREPSYGNYLKCVGSVVFRANGTNGSSAVVNSGIHGNKNHYIDGQWHHFVGVFDAQTGRVSVYVDGEFVANSSQTIPAINPSDSPILIGARYPSPLPFIGDIDEVSILSDALSATQVADLHAGILSPPSDPAPSLEPAPFGMVTLLEDEFDGASINSSLWNSSPSNLGSIDVANDVATFSPNGTTGFPYLENSQPAFPCAGDFVFETALKYDQIAALGDGVVLSNGTTGIFGIWADTGSLGLRVNDVSGTLHRIAFATDAEATAYHTYKLERANGSYTVYVDGIQVLGPTASNILPDKLVLGHPSGALPIGAWSDFEIAYARVVAPEPPPPVSLVFEDFSN